MKHLIIPLLMIFAVFGSYATNVKIEVSGLEDSDTATVSIASYSYLDTKNVNNNGEYIFSDVPDGTHYVKIEAAGYESLPSKTIVIQNGIVSTAVGIKLVVTKQNDNPNEWLFKWEEDGSPSGYTQTSYVNKPAEIEFLGKKIIPADIPSFSLLEKDYHIYLDNEEEPWTQEYAYRLLETLKTLPTNYSNRKYAVFTLTDKHINDDIIVTDSGEGYEVKISKDVFYYANPFLVNLDGVRGRLFSKRLHHALVNFVTDFGRDEYTVEEILFNRFGCRILNVDYEELTRGTTGEDAGRFQPFVPSELVSIINMYEELPEGFHKINHLNYLIRRQNGLKHPLYPQAAAVGWPIENGYIEFMEDTFGGNNQKFDTLRLIIHEKSHFLWAFTLSDEIKNDWIEIGGWYQDPNFKDGWATTKDTEFVTAYAHAINPDEDMAESIAFYLKDPEKLQSRSTDKYEFIRDRIMHGTRYISKIPDHLTFEVLNLNPDYDYPGKIKKTEIKVIGAPDEDKIISMRIELNDMEGFDDGASAAFIRLRSPEFIGNNNMKHSQEIDLWMSPEGGNDHVLSGSVILSKYSKSGHWIGGDITVTDKVGNQRFEGRNDCVTDFYINNQYEDLEPPKYEGNLHYILSDIEVDGRMAQNLQVRFKISDNIGFQRIHARLNRDDQGYSFQEDGHYDTETGEAVINFLITEYFPSTDYWIAAIEIWDKAGTEIDAWFTDYSEDYPIQKIYIETPNPDTEHAELDLQRITVYAEPTHPEAPDGETLVTINFYAKDDKSGLGVCQYVLRDPQGIQFQEYFYHRNFYSTYFDGDPTVWERYTIKCILPQGSAPGIWGLQEMTFRDKAYNEYTYNFVETLIFEPDDNLSDYELFTDLDNAYLTFGINSTSGDHYSYSWRIIHEDSGIEIDGTSSPLRTRATENQITADLSEFPKGEIILIVNVLGEDSQIVSVKTKRLNYQGPKVLIESLTLSPASLDAIEGDTFTITANVIPENATDKSLTWSSSKPEYASVDDEGNVTVLKEGFSIIRAETKDGSNLVAECVVTGRTAIEALFHDSDATVDVYDINGAILIKDCNKANLCKLSPGLYIFRQNSKSVKVLIK